MRKSLILIMIMCILLSPLLVGAEKPLPIEQLILQQHFTQLELERNLELLKQEENNLLQQIDDLDQQLTQKESTILEERKRAGDTIRAYYTGQRESLLSLLFEAKDFNDLLLLVDFLQLLFEHDMAKLERFQQERAQVAKLQVDKHERLGKIKELRIHFEKQLADIKRIQEEKEQNLKTLKDPTAVQSLMDHLIVDWRNRGLPAFRKYFSTLASTMGQIKELATPNHLQPNGFSSLTLTIGQEEFNQFLAGKNDIFKGSSFQFDNNQLVVEGNLDQMNLKIVGQYDLVSPTELKFHMSQLVFDGFDLPQTTIDELEKEYDLGFYPALISPNIRVEGLSLNDHKLQLQVKYELGFSF
ncbi:coiled-coil domain-containing protein [Brevibacillus ginsengisoli]|uniref:coiled-coil domain-containing protein n=1 Tax=Brevibacillus ginsengisoli TaxID=363854 RepID=UPI003CEBC641